MRSSEGHGSTFAVTLRLPRAENLAPPPGDSGILRGVRLLIVDDNAASREVLRRQLQAWGRASTRSPVAAKP